MLCVGNDYNDLDMLRWAGTARVVANAPEDLRSEFTETSAKLEAGAAKAACAWLHDLVGC